MWSSRKKAGKSNRFATDLCSIHATSISRSVPRRLRQDLHDSCSDVVLSSQLFVPRVRNAPKPFGNSSSPKCKWAHRLRNRPNRPGSIVHCNPQWRIAGAENPLLLWNPHWLSRKATKEERTNCGEAEWNETNVRLLYVVQTSSQSSHPNRIQTITNMSWSKCSYFEIKCTFTF